MPRPHTLDAGGAMACPAPVRVIHLALMVCMTSLLATEPPAFVSPFLRLQLSPTDVSTIALELRASPGRAIIATCSLPLPLRHRCGHARWSDRLRSPDAAGRGIQGRCRSRLMARSQSHVVRFPDSRGVIITNDEHRLLLAVVGHSMLPPSSCF